MLNSSTASDATYSHECLKPSAAYSRVRLSHHPDTSLHIFENESQPETVAIKSDVNVPVGGTLEEIKSNDVSPRARTKA